MPMPRGFLFERGGVAVNLYVWLPAMLALGLGMIGLMFAFVLACAKV
jgi:hypothetical protein